MDEVTDEDVIRSGKKENFRENRGHNSKKEKASI